MNDKQFKDNFRIQKTTFKQILDQVEFYLKKQNTVLRSTIAVDERVARTLYSLGLTSDLRTIADLFGIRKSTVANILHEFCNVFVQLFFHRLIKFPVSNEETKNKTSIIIQLTT